MAYKHLGINPLMRIVMNAKFSNLSELANILNVKMIFLQSSGSFPSPEVKHGLSPLATIVTLLAYSLDSYL